MTTEQLISEIEEYYGEYRPRVRDYVFRYVDRRFGDVEKPELLKRIIHGFPTRYRMPPDVAEVGRLSQGMIPPAEQMEPEDISDAQRAENIERLRGILKRLENGMQHNTHAAEFPSAFFDEGGAL